MGLYLEILEGVDQGQRYLLQPGLRLGRSIGEVIVQDGKASALHAEVEESGKDQLILVDRDSSNGIKINGQRVKRVALLPGVNFKIGNTLFRVVRLFGEAENSLLKKKPVGWRDVLLSRVPKIQRQNGPESNLVKPFPAAIELTFLEGPQASHKVIVGYGPRKFGAEVLDVELHDLAAPDVAFELDSQGLQILFKTSYPEIVLLNDKSISSDQLKSGDRIRIGKSLIEVQVLT